MIQIKGSDYAGSRYADINKKLFNPTIALAIRLTDKHRLSDNLLYYAMFSKDAERVLRNFLRKTRVSKYKKLLHASQHKPIPSNK